MKKKVIRTCVLTKKKYEKKNLFRLTLNINNEYELDEKQVVQKRAIYISKDKAIENRLNNKKYNISKDSIEKILKILKVGGNIEYESL